MAHKFQGKGVTILLLLIAILIGGRVAWVRVLSPDSVPGPIILDDWVRHLEHSEVLGDREAPIRIIGFFDFSCPPCNKAGLLLADVIRETPGRFSLFVQHLPSESFHPGSTQLSIGAICAEREGVFEEYFRAAHKAGMARDTDAQQVLTPTQIARTIGLGENLAYQECLLGEDVLNEVDRDLQTAEELEIPGTPTLIVEGRLVFGAPTIEELEYVLSDAKRRVNSAPAKRGSTLEPSQPSERT